MGNDMRSNLSYKIIKSKESVNSEEEDESDENMITSIQDLLISPSTFINENIGNIRNFYRIGKIIG
jgi:hypothetical protein